MNIIIEGPDGSGKSTLARFIAGELNWRIVSSPGPTKDQEEFRDRVSSALRMSSTVFDRHPLISERVYSQFRDRCLIDEEAERVFYERCDQVIVYYRGRAFDLQRHVIKDHDAPEHLEVIVKRHDEVCQAYDQWALTRAHLIHRRDEVKRSLFNLIQGRIPCELK